MKNQKNNNKMNHLMLSAILTICVCFMAIPMEAQRVLSNGKRAYQSSTAHGGVAGLAVDNNTNGKFFSRSVTHTNSEANPWWEVDLGREYKITKIRFFNRTDCCMERLGVIDIYAKKSRYEKGFLWVEGYNTKGGKSHTATGEITARYIRIKKRGNGILSLAEVRVYGRAISKPVSLASNSPVVCERGATNKGDYRVQVKTGTKSGAGTDANIYLTVYHNDGISSEKIKLNSYINGDAFESGALNKFKVTNVRKGKQGIKRITITSDNKYSGAGWYLESIVVDGKRFDCNCWIESGSLTKSMY